ncbi:hypothetical protein G6F42_020985 [Rhizopus arrhizus]|nr:hypothetical protein G6F42_020985 [Rhizopus arrhizus]
MLWGCMTCNGPGYACTIEDGTMKASDHVHILSTTLMDSLNYYGYKQEAIYFQQDNDPKHTSKLAHAWFKENGLKEEHTFHWPAQSPHLDPIEHLWHHLKLRLSLYEGRAKGVHDLWSRIEEEWNSFTKEQCQAYIKNIYHPTHRVVALLVHNEYASTVINKLETAGIKQIIDFNPRNPAHLRDIKYQDLSDTDKQAKMVQIHKSHLLTALDRMRPTIRPAVARDFINKKWITTQNYMDLLKKPPSFPLQDTPVDTDMDDAPLPPPASPKAAQPVPTGDGEPDEQL